MIFAAADPLIDFFLFIVFFFKYNKLCKEWKKKKYKRKTYFSEETVTVLFIFQE